jgi:hypothetical protein
LQKGQFANAAGSFDSFFAVPANKHDRHVYRHYAVWLLAVGRAVQAVPLLETLHTSQPTSMHALLLAEALHAANQSGVLQTGHRIRNLVQPWLQSAGSSEHDKMMVARFNWLLGDLNWDETNVSEAASYYKVPHLALKNVTHTRKPKGKMFPSFRCFCVAHVGASCVCRMLCRGGQRPHCHGHRH